MITIHIPSALRALTQGNALIEESGTTIGELIERLEMRFPGIKGRLCQPDGRLKRFINVFVNGEDVRNLAGEQTTLKDGDEVIIVPAMAGGKTDSSLGEPAAISVFAQKQADKSAGKSEEPFRRVTVEEARILLESGHVELIDVREPLEYNAGHIAGAQLVPLNTLLRQPTAYLTRDGLMFICAVGERSAVACEMAAALGFQTVYNVEGGMNDWTARGYPVET